MRFDSRSIVRFDMPISTDDIIPATRKHSSTDPAQLARHVFENIDPALASQFRPGAVLVSSKIFGIGSSREQAVIALKAAGVILILAPEFGRIFYRNCWNNGVPALHYRPPAGTAIGSVRFDTEACTLEVDGKTLHLPPLNPLQSSLLKHGSLLESLKCQLQHSTV
jgi:3-isopropylmalate/(R)-2-methylmalate dehydratase small subunit